MAIMLPNIFGGYQTRDLPFTFFAQLAEEAIQADIQRWADFYNQTVDLYTSTLAQEGTEAIGFYGAGAGTGEMQPYTEYGETEATRVGESRWKWGAPIRRYRDRQLYTEEYLETATLERLNRDIIFATNRNLTTRIKMILRALLGNTNYQFIDDETFPSTGESGPGIGPIDVVRLFNADNSPATMVAYNEIIPVGNLQSYIPTGTATIDIGNFTIGRQGMRQRGMLGHIVHVISPLDADAVRNMPGFVRPLSIEAGSGIPGATPGGAFSLDSPYIHVENGPNIAITSAITTRPQSIGSIYNGGLSDGEVMVYPFFPKNYVLTFDATQDPPVIIRTRKEPKYKGFRLVQDETKADYGAQALRNKRWEYIAGAAVRNRANGVVTQATTDLYIPPTI